MGAFSSAVHLQNQSWTERRAISAAANVHFSAGNTERSSTARTGVDGLWPGGVRPTCSHRLYEAPETSARRCLDLVCVNGYGRYQKTNSRMDRTISRDKIGKRNAEIKQQMQENQRTGRTISENMTKQIRKPDLPATLGLWPKPR